MLIVNIDVHIDIKIGEHYFQELNSINFELVREDMFGGEEGRGEAGGHQEEEDLYEDEEVELSEDEDEDTGKVKDKRPSRVARLWRWIVSLFNGIRGHKTER